MAHEASYLEIDARALRANVGVFRALADATEPKGQVGVVLKANAYGHGLGAVLPIVHALVDWVYVIAPDDALEIRALEEAWGLPRRNVLVLGAASAEEAASLARKGIKLVVADESFAAWASTIAKEHAPPLGVHLHVDTGLGREGFLVDDVGRVARAIGAHPDALRLEGALSHFANVEDVTEQEYANAQVHHFERALAVLGDITHARLVRHLAASAAALVLPPAAFDVVRIGIALYGLWPSTETRVSTRVVREETPALRPVLSWRVRSQVVRTLPAGSFVGYGCTYRCGAATRVAVLPVGYFDGYPRLLSGRAHVLVNGERCAVLGRVMMNHIVVDVTHATSSDAPVVATLLGRDGDETVSAENLATWSDTINYEIVARLGAHLRRTVIDDAA